jgi:hypothetical protein
MKRRRVLRRRYGRTRARHELTGTRTAAEMLEAQGAVTQRVPRLTMTEQIEYDRKRERTRAGLRRLAGSW